MEKRILLEKRGREANQIKELNLDNCRSTSIEGLTDEFSALEKLSLINVGLTSLKNFPKLPSLRKLELSDNRISNGLNHLLSCPKLALLNLSGNRIKDFDELKALASLEKLEILDLFNNDVTSSENYRNNVFRLIPSLKFLDGFDKDDNEAPTDDEANGNETDDFPDAFCMNGIEIDLKELEELEKRVAAKRQAQSASKCDEINSNSVNDLEDNFEKSLNISREKVVEQDESAPMRPSLASMFLVIMSIFSILNQIYYKPTAQTEDEEIAEEEENDDDEDNDELDLQDVYNDDLEEDNDDWNEGDENEDDDDEISSDEEADETAEKVEDDEGEAESPSARGKKRKHEGDEGD